MKKIVFIFVFILILVIAVIIVIDIIFQTCGQTFNTYPEKGYCEFDLKKCEGVFGCKEYNKVQIPCGSEFVLCEGRGICDCGK